MGQDIRKMMKEHIPTDAPKLSEGHEARFEALLATSFPEKKKNNASFFWLKIAAVGIVLLSLGYFGMQQLSSNDDILDTTIVDATKTPEKNPEQFTLGDISPDLKKVEEFYLTGINVQIASLKIDDENKELMDGYMVRINELDKEYALLNDEMNKVGPSEATVTALIDNLKLRLELLFKLKNKLKELKEIENETYTSIQS
ncbi:hypothetical protein [Ulvibacter litoralis]|uniref:Uncharacterized protein n=1 Tax=Ulvibacter litoralis TaxID=227084 RepID=A0A1G7GTD3_9FLAO|nr:hypothetical protein [Ulvibacter litoralis]GHC55141.1 hypothetical protein GCM10008083_19050 [Ulvibacter litoralis]SDE91410.1 hypothetical protein SAMN05421855_103319 [Ulvibacter litoralis]